MLSTTANDCCPCGGGLPKGYHQLAIYPPSISKFQTDTVLEILLVVVVVMRTTYVF